MNLILFERSRTVADTIERLTGEECYSLDILPSLDKNDHIHPRHIQLTFQEFSKYGSKNWNFIGAHPPCTDLTFANGLKKDGYKIFDSCNFYLEVYNYIKKYSKSGYIENPPFSKVAKFILPKQHEFIDMKNVGIDSRKRYGFHLHNLPPLIKGILHPGPYKSITNLSKNNRELFPVEFAEFIINQWFWDKIRKTDYQLSNLSVAEKLPDNTDLL